MGIAFVMNPDQATQSDTISLTSGGATIHVVA